MKVIVDEGKVEGRRRFGDNGDMGMGFGKVINVGLLYPEQVSWYCSGRWLERSNLPPAVANSGPCGLVPQGKKTG